MYRQVSFQLRMAALSMSFTLAIDHITVLLVTCNARISVCLEVMNTDNYCWNIKLLFQFFHDPLLTLIGIESMKLIFFSF